MHTIYLTLLLPVYRLEDKLHTVISSKSEGVNMTLFNMFYSLVENTCFLNRKGKLKHFFSLKL